MFGTLLLATWVDFLQLANALLRDCPMCGTEKLFADLHRVQGKVTPALADLASGDPERIEAAATAMPVLMGERTYEFDTIRWEERSAVGGDDTQAGASGRHLPPRRERGGPHSRWAGTDYRVPMNFTPGRRR